MCTGTCLYLISHTWNHTDVYFNNTCLRALKSCPEKQWPLWSFSLKCFNRTLPTPRLYICNKSSSPWNMNNVFLTFYSNFHLNSDPQLMSCFLLYAVFITGLWYCHLSVAHFVWDTRPSMVLPVLSAQSRAGKQELTSDGCWKAQCDLCWSNVCG